MNSKELIELIHNSKKKTNCLLFIKTNREIDLSSLLGCGDKNGYLIFGEKNDLDLILDKYKLDIKEYKYIIFTKNAALDLLDLSSLDARVEYGAIIRDHVTIKKGAIIMMGAIINAGAYIGENTMIDMNVTIGGRACIKNNCHIGAGSVIAGVIEPYSSKEVVIEDDVFIGANATVLEGVHIGKGSVIGAGSVVINDVPDNVVVVGVPGRIIKKREKLIDSKVEIINALRTIN